MRQSLSLASIYKKFQSLEQKQILKYNLKLEHNGERLLTLLLRSQERIVNGQEFQSLFPIQKGFSLFNRDVLHVMTLWPPVSNVALNPGLVFFNRAQRHPAVSQISQDIFWPFTIQYLDYVLKLGLEIGNDEYIILCNTSCRSMSGF